MTHISASYSSGNGVVIHGECTGPVGFKESDVHTAMLFAINNKRMLYVRAPTIRQLGVLSTLPLLTWTHDVDRGGTEREHHVLPNAVSINRAVDSLLWTGSRATIEFRAAEAVTHDSQASALSVRLASMARTNMSIHSAVTVSSVRLYVVTRDMAGREAVIGSCVARAATMFGQVVRAVANISISIPSYVSQHGVVFVRNMGRKFKELLGITRCDIARLGVYNVVSSIASLEQVASSDFDYAVMCVFRGRYTSERRRLTVADICARATGARLSIAVSYTI